SGRSGPESVRAAKLRRARLPARGARALGDHVRGNRAGFGERLASQSYDERRRCVSGERSARLPPGERQPLTGFLLGLLFAAGVGIVWAGLTHSEDAAGDDVLRRFIEAHRRSIPTPRFAALGIVVAV